MKRVRDTRLRSRTKFQGNRPCDKKKGKKTTFGSWIHWGKVGSPPRICTLGVSWTRRVCGTGEGNTDERGNLTCTVLLSRNTDLIDCDTRVPRTIVDRIVFVSFLYKEVIQLSEITLSSVSEPYWPTFWFPPMGNKVIGSVNSRRQMFSDVVDDGV